MNATTQTLSKYTTFHHNTLFTKYLYFLRHRPISTFIPQIFSLSLYIWTFWPEEHKILNFPKSFPAHYPQPKLNQNSPIDPKSILILTMKLLYTYFCLALPPRALIWVALIWVAFCSDPKSRNPPQITWKQQQTNISVLGAVVPDIFRPEHIGRDDCRKSTRAHRFKSDELGAGDDCEPKVPAQRQRPDGQLWDLQHLEEQDQRRETGGCEINPLPQNLEENLASFVPPA